MPKQHKKPIYARPFDQNLGSSSMCSRPFDRNIWFFFIYFFFCSLPFDQELRYSLIYFFYFCTGPFDKNIWPSFIYSFFSARPFDQKLGSTLIYFFYLYTTIRPKIMVLINLFILFAHSRSTKMYGPLSFILSLVHDHTTKT